MIWEKKRIEEHLADEYLREKYPEAKEVHLKKYKKVYGFNPLLQKEYGLAGDCTLCSLTTIVCGLTGRKLQEIYDVVEKYAKQYFYKGNGTQPIFIKAIYDKVLKEFDATSRSKVAYFKAIGYDFDKIVSLIESNTPMVLNIYKDGRSFYDNHSIVVVGYLIYQVDNEEVPMLLVYDNWVDRASVVDYKALSMISSINYMG